MIIDLDKDFSKKPEKIEILSVSNEKPVDVSNKVVVPTNETTPAKEEITDQVRQDYLISQIELEERQVRYDRAKTHLKYRDLLNDKMEPKGSTTEFLEIYEEIEGYTDQLKNLWMRKEHIRHFGIEQKSRIIDDATMARIDALKHARGRINDNLYKARKQLTVSKSSGNTTKEANASAKIDQLQFKYLEIQTELKKLEDNV